MANPHLPSDIISMILSSFDTPESLSTASLVSKHWHDLAFPYLHRDVTVWEISQLETLISRFESNISNNVLRLGSCMHTLRIRLNEEYHEKYNVFDKAHPLMPRFRLTLPKLTHLEHLHWSNNRHDVSDLFENFRDSCPRLRMFTRSSTSSGWPTFSSTDYFTDKTFVFKNMTHLNIEWGHAHNQIISPNLFDLWAPKSLIEMLEASPVLVDLTLYHDWVLNLILSLKNPLSKLRRLKLSTGGDPMARGRPTFDMPPPHTHPLGLFIQRLSQVKEIDLGMLVLPSLPSIPLDFDEMVQPSSSLRRFSAPPHLCAGLFASQVITEQLESLTVKPAWLTDPGQHYELINIMGKVAWDLPCLKELIFQREYCAHPPKYLELASMLRAAPGLVKLDIGYFSIGLQEIDKLLELLTYIPVLEELIIFDMVTPPLSTECWDSLNSVLLKLKETCPKLRQIEIYHRRCHNNETSIAHWMDTDLVPRWIPQVNDELVYWWSNLMSNIARNSSQAASYGGYHD